MKHACCLPRDAIRRMAASMEWQPREGREALQLLPAALLAACPSLTSLELSGIQATNGGGQSNGLASATVLVADLSPLTALASPGALRHLGFSHTSVADLAPLARLTALQTLSLSYTPVSDLAPLAACTTLQTLNLSHTKVADLAPLLACTALRTLECGNTSVAHLTPLSALMQLQNLDCSYTKVVIFLGFEKLDCPVRPSGQGWRCKARCDDVLHAPLRYPLPGPFFPPSKVFDLTPLAALTTLQSLDCGGCQAVQQLAPLAALTALHSLLCRGTRVADLGPLSALMALQKLDCSWTAVTDLRPLAGRGCGHRSNIEFQI